MGVVLGFLGRLGIMFWGLLRSAAPTVMAWLGLSFVTHEVAVNIALPQIQGMFVHLPDYMLKTIGMLRVDQAFTVVLGCLAAKKATSISVGKRGVPAATPK